MVYLYQNHERKLVIGVESGDWRLRLDCGDAAIGASISMRHVTDWEQFFTD